MALLALIFQLRVSKTGHEIKSNGRNRAGSRAFAGLRRFQPQAGAAHRSSRAKAMDA
nr:hypothetical protein [uncultured Ottowia sp.]